MTLKSRGVWRPLSAVLAMALLVAACGGDSTDETTTSQVAESSTSEPQADTTTTSAPPDQIELAKEEEWVIAQSGTGAFVDGRDTGFTALRTPVFKAAETLREQGWNITSLWMGSDEEVLQALVQGQADIAYVPFGSILAASLGGTPLKIFSVGAALDFLIVGDSEISGPEDMDGRSIAFQGPVSSGALVARLFVAGQDDVEPIFVTLQGNGPRVTALLAGELDAIAARLGSEGEIFDNSEPGQYEILYSPLEEYPFLIDLTLSYLDGSCDELCKVFAQQLTLEQVKLNRAAIADPTLIVDWIAEYDAISSDERAADLYFEDAGITGESAERLIAVLQENGQLPEGATPPAGADIVDESIWEAIADQVE